MMNKVSQIATLIFFTGCLLGLFQNCGSSEDVALSKAAGNQSVDSAELEQRYNTIENLMTRDLRCSTAADCTLYPVGHKACGGPASYLVTSRANVNLPEISSLLSQFAALSEQYQQANQMISTCEYLMPPQVMCDRSLCVLVN